MKDDNWDEGIMNGYMAFYKNLCEYYDIDVTDANVSTFVTNDNVMEV